MTANKKSSDTITVSPDDVHRAGQNITKDAQDLENYMTLKWVEYINQEGLVPAMCLRNDFDTFYNQQKPLTTKAIENRIKIGQTLQDSSTLAEFQDKVTAKSFDGPNIYAEHNYYPSSDATEPGSLERPQGFGGH